MPKIRCLCDEVIWLGEIPSPHQWLIISDTEYDKYEGQVDAEKVFNDMKTVVKCPNCSRLHIFWDGWGKDQLIYKPEDY